MERVREVETASCYQRIGNSSRSGGGGRRREWDLLRFALWGSAVDGGKEMRGTGKMGGLYEILKSRSQQAKAQVYSKFHS